MKTVDNREEGIFRNKNLQRSLKVFARQKYGEEISPEQREKLFKCFINEVGRDRVELILRKRQH